MKRTVFTSLIWNVAQKFGTTGIQFIVQLVLARLLLPEDYGVVAIVNVFILFANIFVQSGLSTALVQKQDADDTDFSTVFVANLVISILLYLTLYAISPLIAEFYEMPQLILIIRVLSTILLFSAISSVQQAFIQKHMLFKKLFISSLAGIFVSGFVGVTLAYLGKGIWALVFQQLINQLILTIMLFLQIKWIPSFNLSLERLKSLFSFGWKVLISSIVTTLYGDVRTLIIGGVYSASALGFYNKGQQFPKIAADNIVSSIQTVLFPTFSLHQDNKNLIRSMMRRSISVGFYVIAPMMIGLMAVAENLIVVILTDTWIQSVPFLQIYCVAYLFRPLFATNLQSINAIGRSDIFLKMETIKTIIYTIVLGISISYGVYAIALGSIVSSIFALFIYTYPNKKLIDYGLFEQIKTLIPSLIVSVIMGISIYLLNYLTISRISILILQFILGIIVYILLSSIFKLDSFYYLLDLVKNLFINKQHKKAL